MPNKAYQRPARTPKAPIGDITKSAEDTSKVAESVAKAMKMPKPSTGEPRKQANFTK